MKNRRVPGIGGMEQQTVYDLAEKHDSSLDLIEKNLGENDLVYELTEIDTHADTIRQRVAALPDREHRVVDAGHNLPQQAHAARQTCGRALRSHQA
jgi:hypothetical protein